MMVGIIIIVGLIGISGGLYYLFATPNYAAADVLGNLAVADPEKELKFKQRAEKLKPRKYSKREILRINSALPLVLEQLVMTVDAGLNIISGLQIIIKDAAENPRTAEIAEIFSEVLTKNEAGFSLAESLKLVAAKTQIPAIKHTLLHINIAYAQGGELIYPLRELADASQSQYQEEIEEVIAKLPVKATLPLAVIFAGLILFFITAPLIQIKKITSQQQSEISGPGK